MPEIDAKTLKATQDNQFSVAIDGKETRLVREADLMTIKGGSEAKAKEWETEKATFNSQIAELTTSRDTTHAALLQERAAKEVVEAQAKEAAALKLRAGELEKDIATHKKGREDVEAELLGIMRSTFVEQYKVDPKKVEGLTLPQLRDAHKTLTAMGLKVQAGAPARFDGGGGTPGGGQPTEAPLDRAKRIIETIEQKKGKMMVSGAQVGK